MTWNYRVIRTKRPHPRSLGKTDEETFDEFTICEVYYNKDDTIYAYSDAQSPYGETLEELENDLKYMAEALKAPVLNKEEIVTRDDFDA